MPQTPLPQLTGSSRALQLDVSQLIFSTLTSYKVDGQTRRAHRTAFGHLHQETPGFRRFRAQQATKHPGIPPPGAKCQWGLRA